MRSVEVTASTDAVVEFAAVVARIGFMDAVSSLFGHQCHPNGICFPGRDIQLLAHGDERLLIAGRSAIDPGIHVDTAPAWVRRLVDPALSPAVVAWGRPPFWEISDGRRTEAPVIDEERPWLTEQIGPALSDAGTIDHLGTLLPNDEPDMRADADIPALSAALWNSLMAGDGNVERSAGSLRALATHLQLDPVPRERIETALVKLDLLWSTFLPGHCRPRPRVQGPIEVVPRRGDSDQPMTDQNMALIRGWAVAAMTEAAMGIARDERTVDFDECGLRVVRDGVWARLIGFSPDRLVIVGGGESGPRSGVIHSPPAWVPDLEAVFPGTVAWTVRGYWRGAGFTGPLSSRPEFAAVREIKPDRSANLAAALLRVPEPVSAQVRDAVVGMMQGLQDFAWAGAVLATCPAFGSTPFQYPL